MGNIDRVRDHIEENNRKTDSRKEEMEHIYSYNEDDIAYNTRLTEKRIERM